MFTAPYFDTGIAHYLLEPEMNHALPHILAAAMLAYHTLDYDNESRLSKKGRDASTRRDKTLV